MEEEGTASGGPFRGMKEGRGIRGGLGRATGIRIVCGHELQIILTTGIRATACPASTSTCPTARGRGIQLCTTATARGRGDGRLQVLEVVPAGQRLKDLREASGVHILTAEHSLRTKGLLLLGGTIFTIYLLSIFLYGNSQNTTTFFASTYTGLHSTELHGDEYTVHNETRRTRAVITRRRDKRKCKELPGRHPVVLGGGENVYQNKTVEKELSVRVPRHF